MNKCSENCTKYLLLELLYYYSNLPERYRRFRMETTPFENERLAQVVRTAVQKFLAEYKEGHGLYIYSKLPGTGKTLIASIALNEFFNQIVWQRVTKPAGVFINTTEFLEQYRQNYELQDDNFFELLNNIEECDVLILDDLGAERPTEFVRDRLYDIINKKYNQMKSIIVTSNIPLYDGDKLNSQLTTQLSERICSRLAEMTYLVDLDNMHDVRLKNKEAKRTKF